MCDSNRYLDRFLEIQAYKTRKKAAKDRTKAIPQSNPPICILIGSKRQTTAESSVKHSQSLQESEKRREAFYFNSIKQPLLTHFRQHVEWFGDIYIFSIDIRELAHKGEIKEGYKSSDTVNVVIQILDIGTSHQVVELCRLNLEVLYNHITSHGKGMQNSVQGAGDLQILFGIHQQEIVGFQLRMQWHYQNGNLNIQSWLWITSTVWQKWVEWTWAILRIVFCSMDKLKMTLEAVTSINQEFCNIQGRCLGVCRCQWQSSRRWTGMSFRIITALPKICSAIEDH